MTAFTRYRLGLDVGANSIGWCALALDGDGRPIGILDLGTRLLTATEEAGRDPQTKTSLAVDRRIARGMRRRRDRYLRRRGGLMAALVAHGLMPAEDADRKALESLDPYKIRAAALDGPVPPHHLGRALFHLNQRRGFKSNRKSDAADGDAKKVEKGIDALKRLMHAAEAGTVGEYMAIRHRERQTVRARLVGTGKDAHFPFYLDRALIEHEFDALWAAQAPHHPEMTEAARAEIGHVMFFQRPLKEVDPGKCALYPEEDRRAPRALPIAQRFRILKELADLRLRGITGSARPLTLDERDRLLAKLLKRKAVTFDSLRKELDLDPAVRFSLESERRKDLKGDEIAARLSAKPTSKAKGIGPAWHALSFDEQTEIVEALVAEQDPAALRTRLETVLPPDQAAIVAGIPPPERHSRYGRRALAELVALMEASADPETGELLDRPLQEFEAVALLGRHHSDRRPTDLLDRLPYYGEVLTDAVSGTGDPAHPTEARFGRLPNPTVHIALNQLRRLVNALIDRYGPPAEVVIEMARNLKASQERKREIEREQAANEKANDARRARLAEHGQPDNGLNRLLLRLYDELPADEKLCVYTGACIPFSKLFTAEIEIDHILPFSRTLDDGFANKVLCFQGANRAKRNRAPAEWRKEDAKELEDLQERANRLLPANKSARFAPDAMARFADEGDQLPRRLTDTQYIARLARRYLTHVCPDNKVWTTNGRLTALLRGKWGLNALLPDHNWVDVHQPKNRRDHRHHAIDAFVIAVTDRGLITALSHAAGRAEAQEMSRIVTDMPDPFPDFRDRLKAGLDAVIVSHRPNRGVQGKLHEETAYGPTTPEEREAGWTASHRKPVDSLTGSEMARIRDPDLRAIALEALATIGEESARQALRDSGGRDANGHPRPVRRVRLLKREDPKGMVEIRHGRDGEHRKAYAMGSIHHIDIVTGTDGRWRGEGISVFHANQPDHRPDWRSDPDARLVMRLHKGDLVELEHDGVRQVMRVYQLEPSARRVRLTPHTETKAELGRVFGAYSTLQAGQARRVEVDVLGRMRNVRTGR